MATTLRPPAPVEPSGPPPGATSARALVAARESPRRRLLRVLIPVVAFGVLAQGWLVTGIDLGKLTNAPNAAPILKALLTPDVASRDISSLELNVNVPPGGGQSAAALGGDESGPKLQISP